MRPGDLKWLQEALAKLKNDVTIVYITEETSCRHCRQEKNLLIVEDVLSVSEGESGLSPEAKRKLGFGTLNSPARIEVLTTEGCPFSGAAIRIAHQWAIGCDCIIADAVNVVDFPDLVRRYNVQAAPTVVVNEAYQFYGALPEEEFVEQVLQGTREAG